MGYLRHCMGMCYYSRNTHCYRPKEIWKVFFGLLRGNGMGYCLLYKADIWFCWNWRTSISNNRRRCLHTRICSLCSGQKEKVDTLRVPPLHSCGKYTSVLRDNILCYISKTSEDSSEVFYYPTFFIFFSFFLISFSSASWRIWLKFNPNSFAFLSKSWGILSVFLTDLRKCSLE